MTTDISVGLPLPAPDRDVALRTALVQLAEAYAYAKDGQGTPWLFAVERERLLALGVSTNLLRWLWQKGYVDPANEVTSPRDRTRKFRPCHNLVRPKRTCFILTDAGAMFASRVLKQPAGCLPNGVAADQDVGLPAAPYWDGWRRVLRVGLLLVKDYRLPSPTQEAILEAFQEEGWPRRIDDPLPPKDDQDPKCRLHDTIKRLNGRQQHKLLQFSGDGTGTAVCWRYVNRIPAALPAEDGIRRAA